LTKDNKATCQNIIQKQGDAVAKCDYYRWITSVCLMPAARHCEAQLGYAIKRCYAVLCIHV